MKELIKIIKKYNTPLIINQLLDMKRKLIIFQLKQLINILIMSHMNNTKLLEPLITKYHLFQDQKDKFNMDKSQLKFQLI